MAMLSIIIPTFNSSLTLPIAIKSILKQSFGDFEIFVIDGLSNDNTLEIAKSFNDDRIKIFSEEDNGIYDAMNKGLSKAGGEWVYFLGSDDELFNADVLADVSQFVSTHDCDFVYGNSVIVGNASWAKHGTIYDGPFDLKKLLIKNICHQSVFYRMDLIKSRNIRFNINYPVCSDWDFNLKCWSISEFTYIDLTIARFNAGGISTKPTDDSFKNERVAKFIDYFKIKSYFKLRKIIPLQLHSQFAHMQGYKWLRQWDFFNQRKSAKPWDCSEC
jgi:glycosyltransferase involved in cell wall biosynthesis